MTHPVLVASAAGSVAFLVGVVFVWLRMPVFRWSCRHCKRVIAISRFHPTRCSCGESRLVANFCKDCGSWNTSSTPNRHCVDCKSKDVSVGAEYHVSTGWRMRNPNPRRS
jgi:hypothetical protein